MAHMNQEKKARIAAELKKVMPQGWKYSLSVRHHMAIVLKIKEAPIDLIGCFRETEYFNPAAEKHTSVNPYCYRGQIESKSVIKVFDKIFAALNLDNFDQSDSQRDYFHVGHYVDLEIGTYEKPFINSSAKELEAA